MPTARADRLTGPWEVNQEVSRGEDFGFAEGNRLEQRPAGSPPPPPFAVRAGNADAPGRNAIHQGGIVDTPTGEWWGFSMMDANSVGRLTALSPVTWSDGWPYFGLPKNLGRSPRTWVKPRHGHDHTADGAVPTQRRLLGGAPPADLAVEPRARRRQVVADRAQGPPPSAHPRRSGSARRAQHPDAARHRSAIDADRGARRVGLEARRRGRPGALQPPVRVARRQRGRRRARPSPTSPRKADASSACRWRRAACGCAPRATSSARRRASATARTGGSSSRSAIRSGWCSS